LVEKRDAPPSYGARFDDDASTVAREWFSPRRRQHHEVARDPAEDPLLEMPTAHVVRPGPLPTLRLPVRGRHGRRVPFGAHSDVRFVHTSENESGIRPRSLREIVEDLQHVRDLAYSPREPPQDEEVSLLLYQCPSCSRFVSQASEDCACGVRFAPASEVTFQCPECASSVPSGEDWCPVCRVEFRAASLRDHLVYSCPRCGTQVDSEAIRCSCGAWFED